MPTYSDIEKSQRPPTHYRASIVKAVRAYEAQKKRRLEIMEAEKEQEEKLKLERDALKAKEKAFIKAHERKPPKHRRHRRRKRMRRL